MTDRARSAARATGKGADSAVNGAADLRRDQVLRAVLEVITERGYADTRISDVANRAGISPALVIYYFGSKDRLLTEAMRFADNAWYAEVERRLGKLTTPADRLEEVIAMCCLPEAGPEPDAVWLVWLDYWALAARNAEVGQARGEADVRFRELVASLVRDGQQTGDFEAVDPDVFAITLTALLDGLAIQIALNDAVVGPQQALETAMRLAAAELGFSWRPRGAAETAETVDTAPSPG